MLRHIFAFSTVALTLAAGAGQPIKVVLVGESTVNDEGGPRIPRFVRGGVQVVNLARNGRRWKSFRDEGTWAKVLPEKADFVPIQFGHSDQPGKGAAPRLTFQVRFLVRTLFAVLGS
jgi:lysophospholipase L1-like esterase